MAIGLEPPAIEIGTADVLRNAAPALLYEHAIARERAAILASGALATFSGEKTGRSPLDKRIVENPESSDDVWWGSVNIPVGDASFVACRQQALDYLGARPLAGNRRRYRGPGRALPREELGQRRARRLLQFQWEQDHHHWRRRHARYRQRRVGRTRQIPHHAGER